MFTKPFTVPRRSATALAVFAVVTAGTLSTSTMARADTALPSEYPHVGQQLDLPNFYGPNTSTLHLGALAAPIQTPTPNGLIYCMDSNFNTPLDGIPDSYTQITDPQLSYLLWKYETLNTDFSRAALAYLVKVRHDLNSGGIDYRQKVIDQTAREHPGVVQLANEWLAEADAYAGGYGIEGDVNAHNLQSGDVQGIGVRSAAGNLVPGIDVTVTLSGPATFDDGSQQRVVRTTDQAISLPYRAMGTGVVRASFTDVKVPGLAVDSWKGAPRAGGQETQRYIAQQQPTVLQDFDGDEVPVALAALATTATDSVDGDKELNVGAKINDTVAYSGLEIGKPYTITGELFDKATGKTVGIKAATTFTPTAPNGTATLSFDVPANQRGKTLVVFEDAYAASDVTNGVPNAGVTPIASHRDINSFEQSVNVPSLGTVATDTADGDKVINPGSTITDKVSYTGLQPGATYTVSGELFDKATGKGTGVTASAVFTATAPNGVVNVVFPVPASLQGKTLVAFEELKNAELGIIAEHRDITDTAQTVSVPGVGTTATDSVNGGKIIYVGSQVNDAVKYTGLTPGASYTVAGTLMDKATATSTGSTAVATFTASATGEGVVNVQFAVPAASQGKDVVVFEKLWNTADVTVNGSTVTPKTNKTPVGVHENINDEGQTVKIPFVKTTATDTVDGDKTVNIGSTITDAVTYSGLLPNTEYTMSGTLMDKATGKPVMTVDAQGKDVPVTSATRFTTDATGAGVVNIVFDVPLSARGTTIVVFEDVLDKALVPVVKHHNINDKDQTVDVPKIGTTAKDTLDGDQVLNVGSTITDTVAYEKLVPGAQYVVTGELMDKATGKTTGVVSHAEFTASETGAGTVDIVFEVPATLQGVTAVVFETVWDANAVVVDKDTDTVKPVDDTKTPVGEHKDINDVKQSVDIPKMGTTATDTVDGDKVINIGSTITDTVKYEKLKPGAKYTVAGELMDKTTGKTTGVVSHATFTASATGSGTVNIVFPVPETMGGTSLVAFETLWDANAVIVDKNTVTPVDDTKKPVVEHKDITDTEQTVDVPRVGTTAADSVDGDSMINEASNIADTIAYEGLQPGGEYVAGGELRDKMTGKSLGVFAATQFVADASGKGTVKVSFTAPVDLRGKTVVVFETVWDAKKVRVKEGIVTPIDSVTKPVAEHKDVNDVKQTVTLPKLGTVATSVAGGKDIEPLAPIVDKVDYVGLVVGKSYTVSGELFDKATGKGTGVKASTTFTPTSPNGSVTVTFTSTSALNGKDLVAFEEIRFTADIGGDISTVIASHRDPKSTDQSVKVKRPVVPPVAPPVSPPVAPPVTVTPPVTVKTSVPPLLARTGTDAAGIALVGGLLALLGSGAVVAGRRRKNM